MISRIVFGLLYVFVHGCALSFGNMERDEHCMFFDFIEFLLGYQSIDASKIGLLSRIVYIPKKRLI